MTDDELRRSADDLLRAERERKVIPQLSKIFPDIQIEDAYARFLRHRASFAALEQWQIAYLPVYCVWAALVVVLFPPVFGYR